MCRPRPPQVAIAAWIVTGPLGHLYAGIADLLEGLARYAWERARERRAHEPRTMQQQEIPK
jgi:hypothetical protein